MEAFIVGMIIGLSICYITLVATVITIRGGILYVIMFRFIPILLAFGLSFVFIRHIGFIVAAGG